MNIHAHFTGGNIRVLSIEGTDVYVQNEIRDTMGDWFYWAFCVEGAQGQTLTFHFDKPWIGYYGPAVSRDLYHWDWLKMESAPGALKDFTYTFGPEESCVYFAHNMLYHPRHFDDFCMELGLKPRTLCLSERGREVPYLRMGHGSETILLTARHHACEASGSYVLEGVVRELLLHPIPDTEVVVVPFVDYDGVVDGDQGKSRAPYDHNRDYIPNQNALYASVREIRKIAAEKTLRYAFDFHSPWHLGENNDWVFVPQKHFDILKNMTRFQRFLELEITPDSLPYSPDGTFMPGREWNTVGSPCFGTYMHAAAGAELSFTLETPYFKALKVPDAPEQGEVIFTADRARELGRCFARALYAYHRRSIKISFTGDILYNDPMNRWCKTENGYDFMPLFKRVWGRLPDADYLVGNIETTVCGKENTYTNTRWAFNTPEEALDALRNTGFDLLSLANNHCMDRGSAGIIGTLDACDRAGLDHIGLYCTPEESETAFVREVGGIRLGFVNATYGTNAFAHHNFLNENEKHMVKLTQPEETLEGSIHLLNSMEQIEQETNELYGGDTVNALVAPYLARLKQDIQRTKEQCDYVIMLLHSGGQHNPEPDAYTRMLVEKIWEFGADIIVGNHPHIIHPSTLENGRFTAYCLGNIMCSEAAFSRAGHIIDPDYSVVLNLTLEKQEDGSVKKHLSFRLFQIMHDPDRKKAPWTVDTYDQWRKDPYDAYKETILFYANRFMPGMNYTEPMAEYPIC